MTLPIRMSPSGAAVIRDEGGVPLRFGSGYVLRSERVSGPLTGQDVTYAALPILGSVVTLEAPSPVLAYRAECLFPVIQKFSVDSELTLVPQWSVDGGTIWTAQPLASQTYQLVDEARGGDIVHPWEAVTVPVLGAVLGVTTATVDLRLRWAISVAPEEEIYPARIDALTAGFSLILEVVP